MKVVYTDEAINDLAAIADWLTVHYPAIAPAVERRIRRIVAHVAPMWSCHRSNSFGLLFRANRCYISGMTTAEDIEKAVEQLPPVELARFRAWFELFDAKQFDAAIERDSRAGKLDALAENALAAHRAGHSREL